MGNLLFKSLCIVIACQRMFGSGLQTCQLKSYTQAYFLPKMASSWLLQEVATSTRGT